MATGQGDVTISMDDENLLKLMTGQLSAQQVCTLLLMTLYLFVLLQLYTEFCATYSFVLLTDHL